MKKIIFVLLMALTTLADGAFEMGHFDFELNYDGTFNLVIGSSLPTEGGYFILDTGADNSGCVFNDKTDGYSGIFGTAAESGFPGTEEMVGGMFGILDGVDGWNTKYDEGEVLIANISCAGGTYWNLYVVSDDGSTITPVWFIVGPIEERFELIDSSISHYMLAGSVQKIKWTSTVIGLVEVMIEYSTDGGTNWQEVSPANVGDPGAYDWTVPAIESQQCYIKITDADNYGFSDVSDMFTIYICDEELTADLDDNCIVDMCDLAILASQWLKDGNPFN